MYCRLTHSFYGATLRLYGTRMTTAEVVELRQALSKCDMKRWSAATRKVSNDWRRPANGASPKGFVRLTMSVVNVLPFCFLPLPE